MSIPEQPSDGQTSTPEQGWPTQGWPPQAQPPQAQPPADPQPGWPQQSAPPQTPPMQPQSPPPQAWPPQSAPYGQQPDAIWPPPPGQGQGVWPPPVGGPAGPALMVPFQAQLGNKVDGHVCDFRNGGFAITPEGIGITGKAVVPAETRVPVCLVCLLILRGGVLIPLIIFELAKQDRQLFVPWNQVTAITYDVRRKMAGFAFRAPTFSSGAIKLFSLAFKLNTPYDGPFVEAVNQYAPGMLQNRRLPSSTPLVAWILLIALVGVIVIAALRALAPGH